MGKRFGLTIWCSHWPSFFEHQTNSDASGGCVLLQSLCAFANSLYPKSAGKSRGIFPRGLPSRRIQSRCKIPFSSLFFWKYVLYSQNKCARNPSCATCRFSGTDSVRNAQGATHTISFSGFYCIIFLKINPIPGKDTDFPFRFPRFPLLCNCTETEISRRKMTKKCGLPRGTVL